MLGVCLGAVLLLVLVRVWAIVDAPRAGVAFSDVDGQRTVTSISVGGIEWLAGIRVGMRYHAWEGAEGGYVEDGSVEVGTVGVYQTWPWQPALAGVILLLGSLALLWPLPLAGRFALVLASAYITSELVGLIAAPAAWFALAVPAVALQWMASPLGRVSRGVVLMTLLGCAVVIAIMAVEPDAILWREAWSFVATAPLVTAAVLGFGIAATNVRRALRERHTGSPLATAVIRQTAIGGSALLVAEETIRNEHAQWLHEHVAPALDDGRSRLAAGDHAAAGATLDSLADEVRDDIDRDQLAILDWGGLGAALESAGGWVRSRGLVWTSTVRVRGAAPPWLVQVAGWRVVQEALRNAIGHSSATAIAVRGEVGADRVTLEVSDDGVGIDRETLELGRASGHIGVVSMVQRARDVGGSLDIRPNSPRGRS